MASPLYLGSDDFYVDTTPNGGKMLCNYQKNGVVFALFYSTNCKYCDTLLPEFRKLPMIFQGTKFAIINLNRSPDIIKKSADTILPITQVPFIVLYYNGKPYIHYQETNTLKDMVDFLKEALSRLQQKRSFVPSEMGSIGSASGNPSPFVAPNAGTNAAIEAEKNNPLGIPYNLVCDDEKGICYLTFEQIYGKEMPANPQQAQQQQQMQQQQRQQMPPMQQQQMYPQQQMPQQYPQQPMQQKQAYAPQQGYYPPSAGTYNQPAPINTPRYY